MDIVEKRKKQIEEMEAELRLVTSKARIRCLKGMIKDCRKLLELGR